MATNQTLCGKSGLEIPVYLLLGQKRLPVDLIVTKTIYSCFFNHDDSFFARWTVPLTGVEQKKNSNFFPTVARKSSSQPCCEPGLSSSAGPPPLSLSHWLQFDLGRPPLLLLWQVYFNNAGGTGCVGIAGGELWDCGDVGRVCVWWRECVPAFTATVYSSWGKREGPLLLTQGNHHHQNCNFCSPMIPLTHHWSWLITPLQLLFPCICLRGSWPLSFLFLTLPCPPTHVLLIGRTKVLQP